MLFNSLDFIFVFLPVVLAGYFVLGGWSDRAAKVWLCLASFVFYAWLTPAFLILLIASIAFNYTVSLLIARSRGRGRDLFLAIGVAGDLAALAYFKYAAWVLAELIGLGAPLHPLTGIVLPLGISFFTFTQIGYLIDVKDEIAKERGLINYVLFVTFFPHLIAGPILHNREVMPQFAERDVARFRMDHVVIGLTVFLLGLFKKTVIADGVAPTVAAGFNGAGHLSVAAAWVTILSFACQLYFDFSGYSDMAIGLARMFNVKFPLNFNSPYKAQNIADFWQRWHMTLTRYLNAYLYNTLAMPLLRTVMRIYPRAKDPEKKLGGFVLAVALPTFWTMTLAGIWHGAGGQFVIFGLLHATFITVYRFWSTFGRKRRRFKKGQPIDLAERFEIALSVLITLVCVAAADVFFRAANVGQAMQLLSSAVGLSHHGLIAPQEVKALAAPAGALVALLGIIWWCPNIYQILGDASPALATMKARAPAWLTWRLRPGWAVGAGLVGAGAIMAIGRASQFLYFQF
jgi:D-alanyl-lipoteichoic acid acyltransferase DltB (MBOAT superfamily)